jgi:hypothetical protein
MSGRIIWAVFFSMIDIIISTRAVDETIFQSSLSNPRPPNASGIAIDGPIVLQNTRHCPTATNIAHGTLLDGNYWRKSKRIVSAALPDVPFESWNTRS